jgi:hypothetical protein
MSIVRNKIALKAGRADYVLHMLITGINEYSNSHQVISNIYRYQIIESSILFISNRFGAGLYR